MKFPPEYQYAVRLIDLPDTVEGFVSESDDGFSNVYLNARMNLERQRSAFAHEMRHIRRDDLRTCKKIQQVEDA